MIASQKQLTKRLFPDYKVITKLRIARGRIVQTGTADDLVSHPANRYVANILRLSNIFHGRAVAMSDGPGLEVGGVVVPSGRRQSYGWPGGALRENYRLRSGGRLRSRADRRPDAAGNGRAPSGGDRGEPGAGQGDSRDLRARRGASLEERQGIT